MNEHVLFELGLGAVSVLGKFELFKGQMLKNPVGDSVASVIGQNVVVEYSQIVQGRVAEIGDRDEMPKLKEFCSIKAKLDARLVYP